jgi:hypothetical protein
LPNLDNWWVVHTGAILGELALYLDLARAAADTIADLQGVLSDGEATWIVVDYIVCGCTRRVRVRTPNMDAAMPILTDVVMIPCIIQMMPLNRDVILAMSNLVQVRMNC